MRSVFPFVPVRLILFFAFLLLIVLSGAGCGERKKPKAAAPAKEATSATTKFDEAARDAQIKKKEEVPYVGLDLKDPFESVVSARKIEEEGIKQRLKDSQSPLHRYDVQSFKVIGIIEKAGGNVAMLIAPDGKGYMVEKGMTLGMNEGRIIEILPDVVKVEEVRKNYRGDVERKIIPIQLPKPKEAQTELWDSSGK